MASSYKAIGEVCNSNANPTYIIFLGGYIQNRFYLFSLISHYQEMLRSS